MALGYPFCALCWFVISLYTALGLTVMVLLFWCIEKYGISSLKLDDVDWTFHWLLEVTIEYYAACLSVCAVVVATEEKGYALLWVFGMLLFGSPVGCAYVIYRIYFHHSLAIESKIAEVHNLLHPPCVMVFYTIIAIIFVALWIWACVKEPLFPSKVWDPKWNSAWLGLTLYNYYAVASCLCGIALATESKVWGIVWTIGFLIPGTGTAPFYIVTKCCQYPSLALTSSEEYPRKYDEERDVWVE